MCHKYIKMVNSDGVLKCSSYGTKVLNISLLLNLTNRLKWSFMVFTYQQSDSLSVLFKNWDSGIITLVRKSNKLLKNVPFCVSFNIHVLSNKGRPDGTVKTWVYLSISPGLNNGNDIKWKAPICELFLDYRNFTIWFTP